MASEKRLLEVLITINAVYQDKGLEFGEKLQHILLEVVRCMQAKSGSLMLVKGRKSLEVAASTTSALIGLKQRLDEESPSAWVVKNRVPLHLADIAKSDTFQERFEHYEGAAFLVVPIIGHEKVIGVLSVTDKIGKDIFSKEEQEVLLRIAGQIIGALENQRLTESLRKKRRTLQKKNLELRKLEKLKTELFNMLIHDLKGPISEMVANLDILTYTISGENLTYVESAQTGCDTLYRMVSNLLDIARLEENKLELIYEKIDPQDIIKESVARIFGLAKIKGLSIVEDSLPSEGRDFLWADRDVLLRVLQNLLNNALQYSPPGETIEIGSKYLKPPKIEFFVKDGGPGIPPQYQEAIFDKFKQIEKKADGRIYTTGLGLTFCKMAVEAHQGRIEVKSDGTKGTCFSFALPLGVQAPKGRKR